MQKITISVPLAIYLPRKTKKDKRIALSLNVYRNQQFFETNQTKKVFHELMKPKLAGLKFEYPSFEYKIYYKDKRRHDKLNFVAIIAKYFLDSMVENGCIIDDCDKYFGTDFIHKPEIDKVNPRCDITIIDAPSPNTEQQCLI